MRLIFSVLTAIVVIAAAIIFIGPLFISTEEVRNQLFAQVESATGYRLRVSGPVDVTLFPSLQLVAEDVGVAQPAVSGDAEFATAKTVEFGLMLQGLLDGKMRVTEVTLIDPVIAVPKTAAKPQAGDAADGRRGGQSGGGVAPVAERLKTLTLDELVIKNGTVILSPSGDGPGKRIEKLDLEASLPGFSEPLSFDVAAVVDGKAVKADGSIGNFGEFLEGAPAPIKLAVDAPGTLDAPAILSGTATYKNDELTFSQFSAKSGDKTLSGTAVYKDDAVTLSQFTATMGRDSFAGNAIYKDSNVTVNPLRANVRGHLLSGSVTADLTNKVPYIVAALATETLNVNALTGKPASKPSGGGGGGSGGGGAGGGGGGAVNSGWSNAPIDYSPLRQVNGKLNISAEELIYDQIKISPVTLNAALAGGKLNATLSDFKLYGGSGKAAAVVDASGKTPAQRVQLSLAKFDAYPFLRDAAGFENLEGRGTINLDLGGSGASQRAIVSTLNGTANIKFVDGAIRGVNIAKMLRNLGTGIIEGWQGGASEKTDFASLGAGFNVVQGKATTQDLHLAGPLVRMTGAGTVNLPAKHVNFRVDPQLVASLEGQGGQKDLAGLGVPVMVVGPWARPKVYPDIKGILENPAAAYERLKQFGDGVVKLPGLEKLDKTGALPKIIQDGKINKDALIEGLGGLLNKGQPAPATAPAPAAAAPEAPVPAPQATVTPEAEPKVKNKKKSKDKAAKQSKKDKKQAASEPAQDTKQKIDAEDAARQLLENFLNSQ